MAKELITPIPQYRDQVASKLNDTTGVVDAWYIIDGEVLLDVRGDSDEMYYATPAKNWNVTCAALPEDQH